MGQLPLALRLEAHTRFATFVAGSNHAVLHHVETLTSAAGGGFIWLWGGPGCGKSHLLQAACRAADLAGKRAMYLPLGAGDAADPNALADLQGLDLLALDQLERVAGNQQWERQLFLALNNRLERREALLVAARRLPVAVGFALPDLTSRAAAAVVYRLQPLTEDEQLLALTEHARARGLELDAAVAQYLLNRVERDMRDLTRWLDRLDRASLIAQRKLTIPFIRQVIRENAAAEDRDSESA